MPRSKHLASIILIVSVGTLILTTALANRQNSADQQKTVSKERKMQRRTVDENRFPVADYSATEPTDPSERAKRQARGKKYDNSQWRIYPHTTSSMARVDSVNRNLPALPLGQSTAIVVGQVTDAKAYLSNDKTGVYSIFTLRVDEILKNSPQRPLSTASSLKWNETVGE